MTTGRPTSGFTVPSNVLIQQLPDGEAVMLDLETERYFSLDHVGHRMVQELTAQATVDEACGVLVKEFDIDAVTLRGDMEALIDQLRTENLLASDSE